MHWQWQACLGPLCQYPAWLCDCSAWRLSSFCGPAVKENAAEACTTACQDEQSAGLALAAGQGGDKDADNARIKEAFESCYTKCVAQETKDVAEERQKVGASAASAFQLCVDLEGRLTAGHISPCSAQSEILPESS